MPTYSAPGVYITEGPLNSAVPSTVGGTAAVFFGAAERGPEEITLVNDWASYKKLYGDLKDAYDLGYAVYHFFANGGRSCYIVRVVGTDDPASPGTPLDPAPATARKLDVPYYPTGDGAASAALFDVAALSAGTWGNDLSVQIESLTTEAVTLVGLASGLVETTDTAYGTFNLIVKLAGVEVERWPSVSIDPDGNRYVATIVNTYSKFISISNVSTEAPDATLQYVVSAQSLAGGTEGILASDDIANQVDQVDTVTGTLILNAVGDSSATTNSALVAKAEARGDSIVVIDPDITSETIADLTTTASNLATLGAFGVHYAPALKMVDPAKSGPGAVRDTYPGGAIAGLIVRTDTQRSVAKAPAGYAADIRGALGTTIKLSNDDIGTLYEGNPYVNSFKVVPGGGVVAFGARTLEKVNSDKYLPIRRSLNYLRYNLKELTQFAVFEPNDENLWSRLTVVISGFLTEFYREGGLKGTNASKAFYVVCNSSNNTPTSVDQGIVNIEVGVALQNPAEYIVINLSQWSGGSNTVESL